MLGAQPWGMLRALLDGVAADPAPVVGRLKRYADLIIRWNRTTSNVMSKNDEGRIVVRHFAESLMAAGKMSESGIASWMDFGSGAGFPAIPLMLAGIGKRWLLVESRRQKAIFLLRAIQELKLENVTVAAQRLENLDPATVEIDGFTSRATEGIELTLELAARHVRPGGRAFLWQKASWPADVDRGVWAEQWEESSVTRMAQVVPSADGQQASCVVEFLRG